MMDDAAPYRYRFDDPYYLRDGALWLPHIAEETTRAGPRHNGSLMRSLADVPAGGGQALLWHRPMDPGLLADEWQLLGQRDFFRQVVRHHPDTMAVNIFCGTITELERQLACDGDDVLSRRQRAMQQLEGCGALLSQAMNHEMAFCAMVDATAISDPLELLSLSNAARYEYVQVFWRCADAAFFVPRCWRCGSAAYGFIGDDDSSWRDVGDGATALLLPPCELMAYPPAYGAAIERLMAGSGVFRCIAQERLSLEWHGLQCLHYHPAFLNNDGERLLQGFAAAGGELIAFKG